MKDLFSSDPYVVIRYGEKELRRTSIVFQNRTNPTWEQTFVIPLLHLCGGRLHFLVYDWDEGKEDDFMGRFSLDMSALTLDKEFPFDQLLLSETNERDGERGSLSGLLLLKVLLLSTRCCVCIRSDLYRKRPTHSRSRRCSTRSRCRRAP